ncbi:hypothetical protein Tco_0749569 [Tanacetum coccineum]|uniref:Uncharacterized protein n=1 Tax=Tanacetum coccineum TaxID=301880 RepID=A0ABQ4Z1U9_9ASTR
MSDFEKNPTVIALREKISTLFTKVKEHKANLVRMMLESQKWASYQASLSTLELQIASLEAEKARLEAVKVSLRKEVDDVKQDRMEVISKVVPYAAMKLMHNDDLGSLVGRLVSSAIFYERCKAFEQVARMKEPFVLSKVKGYLPSYKKEDNQAGNDLAIDTFPWLSEFVADPSAPVEVNCSNPMSFPADAFIVKPLSSQGCDPLDYVLKASKEAMGKLTAHVWPYNILSNVELGKKDCVTFNPLQISANMPSRKCFSSFELIIHGTPNLHTMYSHINLSACLSLIVVRGFASTHFVECSIGIAKIFKPQGAIGKGPRMTSISTSLVRCSKVIEASLLNASAYFTLNPSDVFDRIAVKALQGLFCLLQVFSDHWLLGCVAALMLSVKAIRYIIRTSPCIGAMSISKSSINFFISWSAASASASASTPLDRKRLRAANFPLRLCFSSTTMVLGIYVISAWVHAKTSVLDLRSNKLYGESDLTMTKLRVSLLARGGLPIVISIGISLLDQDFFLENPIRGTFESILDALMEGFNFMKQCAEKLLSLITEGNVISLPPEMKSSNELSLM